MQRVPEEASEQVAEEAPGKFVFSSFCLRVCAHSIHGCNRTLRVMATSPKFILCL